MRMLYHPNVETIGQLRFIKVDNCNTMKNLFSFSVAKRLCQLEGLEVSNCKNITELIEEKEEIDDNDILEFNKLRILKLYNLNRFNGLWHSQNTPPSSTWLFDKKVNFPALEILKITGMMTMRECHRVEIMFANSGETSSQQSLFWVNEVNFPVLEKLNIHKMDNLERLWADQLVEHSFSKITSIDLEDCPKLVNVFPLSMLTRLQRLERLEIRRCESIEEIISEEGGSNSSSNSSSGMPSLSAQFIQSFDFPNLTSLSLWNLPNLKSIHHNRMHTMNWPSLEEMTVSACHAVEILFANSGETSSQQSLFWVNESTFPNLHHLSFGWNAGIKDTKWHCQGQRHSVSPYFPNLKVVRLSKYPEQVTVLPSYLSSLPNFQTLEIRQSCFKEMIFQSEEGGEEKPASLLLSQITELRLRYLPELMHLWKEKEGFPNLRILHVLGCPGLQVNLVPSSVSFRNLVTLEVWHCDGIIKLITHSTAKSLVQLQQMRIGSCENIEQVIQGGDDDDDDEISFPQLNSLELVYLPKLESFCSSDKYTFGFPSLQFLVVHECPEMKMFSQGHSNTPMLHKVRLNTWSYEQRWEGNLNSTVQKVFREKHPTTEECENFREDQSKPSTSNTQNLKKEVENFVKDQDSYSTSKEDQNKPSTSNTQNLTAIMENSSTSNCE
ncbi:hypothetical protein V6N13_103224 [Hibiscus sabdariffa]